MKQAPRWAGGEYLSHQKRGSDNKERRMEGGNTKEGVGVQEVSEDARLRPEKPPYDEIMCEFVHKRAHK